MSMNYTKMQMEETCIVICRSDTNIYIAATISCSGIPWNIVLWITSKEVLLPFQKILLSLEEFENTGM